MEFNHSAHITLFTKGAGTKIRPSRGRINNPLTLSLLIIFSILSLLSCANDKDDKEFTLVKELRILAITVEPPEAKTDSQITLSGLAVDPQQNPLAYGWFLSLDRSAKILDPENADFLGAGEQITFTPSLPSGRYNIFLVVTAGDEFPPPQEWENIKQIPHAQARKKIIISDNENPNQNPEIIRISLEPNSITPGEKHLLKTEVTDADDQDNLAYNWFSLSEGLQKDTGNPVEWIAPPDFEKTMIYLVVRDGRGGQVYETRELKRRKK